VIASRAPERALRLLLAAVRLSAFVSSRPDRRDERHVFPELLLQIDADPAFVAPDQWCQAARNSSLRELPAQPFIGSLPSARMARLPWMNVRKRAIDQSAEHVVPASERD
jgi:hypothetical protein